MALIFVVAALVLFILGAVGVPIPRVNLVSAGLACLAAAQLAGRF
jgi:hypothetical protein